jgi:hypothetical protein
MRRHAELRIASALTFCSGRGSAKPCVPFAPSCESCQVVTGSWGHLTLMALRYTGFLLLVGSDDIGGCSWLSSRSLRWFFWWSVAIIMLVVSAGIKGVVLVGQLECNHLMLHL